MIWGLGRTYQAAWLLALVEMLTLRCPGDDSPLPPLLHEQFVGCGSRASIVGPVKTSSLRLACTGVWTREEDHVRRAA